LKAIALGSGFDAPRTGDFLGSRVPDASATTTIVDYNTVDDPGLQAVFDLWDESLAPPDRDPVLLLNRVTVTSNLTLWHTALRPGAQRPFTLFVPVGRTPASAMHPVDTIVELSGALGLPTRDVCKAAGVRTRTYYSWRKAPHTQQRISSENRLWDLRSLIDDLVELLEVDLRLWIRQADRRKMLTGGQFDQLLLDATTERAKIHPMEGLPIWATSSNSGDEVLAESPPVNELRRQATERSFAKTRRRTGISSSP